MAGVYKEKARTYNITEWDTVHGTYTSTEEGVLGAIVITAEETPSGRYPIGMEVSVSDINGWIRVLRDLRRGMRWELVKHFFGKNEDRARG